MSVNTADNTECWSLMALDCKIPSCLAAANTSQLSNDFAEEEHFALYSVSQKSSPPKTFCSIFFFGEPVQLKITLVIARTYSYVYTNFGPFI